MTNDQASPHDAPRASELSGALPPDSSLALLPVPSPSDFLLLMSEALGEADTVRDIAKRLEHLARAALDADFMALVLLDPGARWLRYLDHTALPDQLGALWTGFPLSNDSPSAAAIRDRRPVYVTDAATLDTFPEPVRRGIIDLGLTCGVYLPLLLGSSPLGSLNIGWSERRRFDTQERRLLAAIASFVAVALQRCLLAESGRDMARVVQEALLSDLPAVPGLQLTARYVPATVGQQIGGDWYDAFRSNEGALTVVIGDVTGHDIAAAAQMGHLRASVRTLIAATPASPARALEQIDELISHLSLDTTATCVIASIEVHDDGTKVRWCNAGHPPPLLITRDGSVDLLEAEPEPLLGLGIAAERTDHVASLPPGSTLVLYTDGLVERRDADLDTGIEALRATAAPLSTTPMVDLMDSMTRTLLAGGNADDVAVLGVRVEDTSSRVVPDSGSDVPPDPPGDAVSPGAGISGTLHVTGTAPRTVAPGRER